MTNSCLLRVTPKISSCVRNNALSAFQKLFLKCTSPVDHSLCSNTKPCCHPLNTFSFGCFGIYSTIPLLHIFVTLRELFLIMTSRMQHATGSLGSPLGYIESKVSFTCSFYHCHSIIVILSLSSCGEAIVSVKTLRMDPHRLLKRAS